MFFRKDFVHVEWSDVLNEKWVILSDSVGTLRAFIEGKDIINFGIVCITNKVADSFGIHFPFDSGHNSHYKFCYYDPNIINQIYSEKVGDDIVIKECFTTGGEWRARQPQEAGVYFYSIPPKRNLRNDKILTYRQISKWLADGNGEILHCGIVSNYLSYDVEQENEPISSAYLVRKWGDKEWFKPPVFE